MHPLVVVAAELVIGPVVREEDLCHLRRERCHEKQFRGGLVLKARRLFVSLNSRPRVIKREREREREVS